MADKQLIALDITKANSERRLKLNTAVENLKNVRSFCSFTISNTGRKEAQEINLELPREGIYLVDRLGEATKETDFKKVIGIGKLNPGGKITIATWNKDYDTEVDSWEQSNFRVTHTNGTSEVFFLPENTTLLGALYENFPYATFATFVVVLMLTILLGWAMAKADEKEKAKKLQAQKEQVNKKEPSSAELEADPPSPS